MRHFAPILISTALASAVAFASEGITVESQFGDRSHFEDVQSGEVTLDELLDDAKITSEFAKLVFVVREGRAGFEIFRFKLRTHKEHEFGMHDGDYVWIRQGDGPLNTERGLDYLPESVRQKIIISNKPYKFLIPAPKVRAKTAEQAGTGQPATRSQSKSEGSDKPQPESEGRSR